eukprot:6519780-Pyramimonas_sp.AAC.1
MGHIFVGDACCPTFEDADIIIIPSTTLGDLSRAVKLLAQGTCRGQSGVALGMIVEGGAEILQFFA